MHQTQPQATGRFLDTLLDGACNWIPHTPAVMNSTPGIDTQATENDFPLIGNEQMSRNLPSLYSC